MWRWMRHGRLFAFGAEEVSIVYRRSREDAGPLGRKIENAEKEGIIFRLLTNPVRLEGNGKPVMLTAMICQKDGACLANRMRPAGGVCPDPRLGI